MKIIILTQNSENYGAHDWNGEGECPQHWKFKGGDTFVVPNLTANQVKKVESGGISTLKAMIEETSDSFEVQVISWAVAEDDTVVCDPWDCATMLYWENNRWIARRVVKNDQWGYLHQMIASKNEEYELGMAGQRINYTVTFTLRDGRVMTPLALEAVLK